jgi:hypothetical protein
LSAEFRVKCVSRVLAESPDAFIPSYAEAGIASNLPPLVDRRTCHTWATVLVFRGSMVRETGQVIRRGPINTQFKRTLTGPPKETIEVTFKRLACIFKCFGIVLRGFQEKVAVILELLAKICKRQHV